MAFDGFLTQNQLRGHLCIGHAICDQLQHFQFALAQLGEWIDFLGTRSLQLSDHARRNTRMQNRLTRSCFADGRGQFLRAQVFEKV